MVVIAIVNLIAFSYLETHDEVPGGVGDCLHRRPRVLVHRAGREQLSGRLVLQSKLTGLAPGHAAEATGPVGGGQVPVGRTVAAGGGARRDLVHEDLGLDQQGALDLVVHGGGGGDKAGMGRRVLLSHSSANEESN